ncbi:MAG: hypothetical protein J3R72DRAFT_496378 [Linnemannia gamsii]|nr:MAG: hypothetical protein J3R72DRAFT_496378 [Linnemannia gamsii]
MAQGKANRYRLHRIYHWSHGFHNGRVTAPPPMGYRGGNQEDTPAGYFGVFSQKPGQDEDRMTQSNVKTGYIDESIIVQNETILAQGMLVDRPQDPKKEHDLGVLWSRC